MIGTCPACGKDPGFGAHDWVICPHCGARPSADARPTMSNPSRFDETIAGPGARRERARFDERRDFYRPVDGGATVRGGAGPAWGDAPVQDANSQLDDRTLFDRGPRGAEPEAADHTVVRGGRKGIRGPLAYVVERNGIRAGRAHYVADDTGIGRDAANEVVIGDETVSRRHARIKVEDGTFLFWDLASANYSFVVNPDGTKTRILEPHVLVLSRESKELL